MTHQMSDPYADEPAADPSAVGPVAPSGRPTLRQRLAAHFNEYGRIAIITYFTLSILTIIGFSVAIGIGAEPSSATGVLGVIGAGWLAAKATLPLRILITLAITPVVAVVVNRLRPRGPSIAPEPDPPGDAPPAGTPPDRS